jgi:hypothetical protein
MDQSALLFVESVKISSTHHTPNVESPSENALPYCLDKTVSALK